MDWDKTDYFVMGLCVFFGLVLPIALIISLWVGAVDIECPEGTALEVTSYQTYTTYVNNTPLIQSYPVYDCVAQ